MRSCGGRGALPFTDEADRYSTSSDGAPIKDHDGGRDAKVQPAHVPSPHVNSDPLATEPAQRGDGDAAEGRQRLDLVQAGRLLGQGLACLLYTSDAADE